MQWLVFHIVDIYSIVLVTYDRRYDCVMRTFASLLLLPWQIAGSYEGKNLSLFEHIALQSQEFRFVKIDVTQHEVG